MGSDVEVDGIRQDPAAEIIGAAASNPAALFRGLRRRGDEAQFTQVLWSLADAEPDFAAGFVRALLNAVRAAYPEKAAQLEPVPSDLKCRAELALGDKLGRLDLCFEDENDFTLYVENKLYSGYGEDQVDRYLAALDLLPAERSRTGLLAVTRDIPGYGEPPTATKGWLGSIRWATLLSELEELPLPPPLDTHWRLFLSLVNQDGDLGMIAPDVDAIQDWANYAAGRDELAKLLLQVRDWTLGRLRELVAEQYPTRAAESLVDHHTFGKTGKVPVKHELAKTWIGFRIPAAEKQDPGVVVQVTNHERRPLLMVEARPFVDDLNGGSSTVATAGLRKIPGIYENRGAWGRSHEVDEWLNQPDVPVAVKEVVAGDLAVLISSGIFDADVAEAHRKRPGLGRFRRARGEDADS